MVRIVRYVYAGLALALVAGVILQVFLAGLGLFAGSDNFVLHTNLGWILHLAPIVVLVAAALAGPGRSRILQATLLAVVVWWVPILAVLRHDLPEVAAFHPLAAFLAFWLALVVARGAVRLARGGEAGSKTTVPQWLLVVVVVVILGGLSFGGPTTA